jgi:hypothetical protein
LFASLRAENQADDKNKNQGTEDQDDIIAAYHVGTPCLSRISATGRPAMRMTGLFFMIQPTGKRPDGSRRCLPYLPQ